MFSEVFSITAISRSPVIRWAYEHYVSAVEVKNFAKITFLSFNTTAVFLHDVMVPENDVLEAGWCSWCSILHTDDLYLFL